jgi:hypothetical protein
MRFLLLVSFCEDLSSSAFAPLRLCVRILRHAIQGFLIAALLSPLCVSAAGDWLVDPTPFKARVTASADGREVELSNGLIRRVIRLRPDAATVAFDDLMTGQSLLRSVRPEAQITLNGTNFDVGGLVGQPIDNYINAEWLDNLTAEPSAFHYTGMKTDTPDERIVWRKRKEWLPNDPAWPPAGAALILTFAAPTSLGAITVEVHYELYDGLPLLSKWFVLRNDSSRPIVLNSMLVEELAVVEPESMVGGSAADFSGAYRSLDVFSDYAFGGAMNPAVDAPAVHWTNDPAYGTQVHYAKQTPCLLRCAPPIGPGTHIPSGRKFESFHVFELVQDSAERERRGLALRHAYRTLAPWTQENPILMHVTSDKPAAVKEAIDQCASVGFEMAIMSFGSGFDMENEDPAYLAQIRALAEYGRARNVKLGGYSLLASRSINAETDVINPATGKPGGAIFGNSPCLCSRWAEEYFYKLRHFFEVTTCEVLENDGSYPGDVCASTQHRGHLGLEDSQWRQWKNMTDFYQWCRTRGIYLNVPDWYYLAGSSKCGMGYRESNWSLPREQQEIIERQNIYDGTWQKTPSMGWMFVPLTEYQGGGAAATIEPLKDHLAHYETRLADLFGAGVQACYRGPRLYDTDETKAVVQKWVSFYKAHRAILDSDIIHLRRPDGRGWDGWLHVNPSLSECGLAMLYNPLSQPIEQRIRLPLYYTGLTDRAVVKRENGESEAITLERDYTTEVSVKIPARGRTWIILQRP